MPITEAFIKEQVSEHIDGVSCVDCIIEDGGDCGGAKVELTVVSDAFQGKPLLKRHRMVNEIFDKELKSNAIHALTIKAYTEAQWEAKK